MPEGDYFTFEKVAALSVTEKFYERNRIGVSKV